MTRVHLLAGIFQRDAGESTSPDMAFVTRSRIRLLCTVGFR